MKNKIIFGILFIFTLVIALSCEKDDKWKDSQTFDSSYPVCGTYVVTWTQGGSLALPDPTILTVYNSANHDGIWIDDNKQFWTFKVKANLSGNTFSVTKGIDILLNDSTTIKNGSVSGDNIYMELEWVSDPGKIYVCQGKRQTGFEQ
ncbi:MAG: hypothetical protein HXX18_00450 [Bacteroidetes bacterium]|nr:hypothetical protein [Bacteroidota bacterium]